MNRSRSDGLIFIALGALLMILLGWAGERGVGEPLVDLRGLYFPARCLLQGGDPYAPDAVMRVYKSAGTDKANDRAAVRQIATQMPYPPSVFALSVPLAMFPWSAVQVLWMALTAGMLTLSAVLIWSVSAGDAPLLAGLLIGFLLGNSEVLLIGGNAAGVVVSLCAIAVWCFMSRRFEAAGVVCLALALAVKPQDAGFVWLYLLLAGSTYRRRAWQTLGLIAALSAVFALWVWRIAPQSIAELQANIAAYSVPGGTNDPSPASGGGHGLAMMVNLQTVFSFIRNEPHFYNCATYLVCAAILAPWIVKTLRLGASPAHYLTHSWIALAAIAGFTMLPVYHRQYDTKLLLFTIPACACLWAGKTRIGRLTVVVNAAAIALNGDLVQAAILGVVRGVPVTAGGWGQQFAVAVQVFPAPLSLLASSIAFLWLYLRCKPETDRAHTAPSSAAE